MYCCGGANKREELSRCRDSLLDFDVVGKRQWGAARRYGRYMNAIAGLARKKALSVHYTPLWLRASHRSFVFQ